MSLHLVLTITVSRAPRNFDVFSLISTRYSVWLVGVGVPASVVSLVRCRGDPLLGKLGHERVIVV